MHDQLTATEEQTGPPPASGPVRARLGPSFFFLPGTFFANPLFWVWGLVLAFRYSAVVRLWLWHVASMPSLQRSLVGWYTWLNAHDAGTCLLYGACAIMAHALIRYTTTNYSITADGDLVVNTGLLGLRTPRGPLISYENTVSYAMITDVDVSRNLLQMLFGTGTLVVTFTEPNNFGATSTTIHLPFVANAREKCDRLMSKAGVKRARFVV